MESLQQFHSLTRKDDSVTQWLSELRSMTESECMNVLQGKSLIPRDQPSDGAEALKKLKDGIDSLRHEADKISADFSEIFKCLEDSSWAELQDRAVEISQHIQFFIQMCQSSVKETAKYITEQHDMLLSECTRLIQQAASFCSRGSGDQSRRVPLVNQLTFVGQSFSRLVDLTLGLIVQRILDHLDSMCLTVVHAAIACIIRLGLDGEHMCFIIAREGGVRGLLEICRRDSTTFTCSQALRALATICCAPECIAEFEQERGVDLVLDLLCEFNNGCERIQGEAAGVIAQLTSPALQIRQCLPGLLEALYRLLQALLNLCTKTLDHEVFLLTVAAVANITFLHSQASSVLLQLQAPQLLVTACSLPKANSLFAKDQVATILANMATSPACQKAIRQQGGVQLLVQFLCERPLTFCGPAEVAACEHVQQKAAIALSRLCCGGTLVDRIIITKGDGGNDKGKEGSSHIVPIAVGCGAGVLILLIAVIVVVKVKKGSSRMEIQNGNSGKEGRASGTEISRKSDSSAGTAGNGSKSSGSTPRSSSDGSDKISSNPNYASTVLQEVDIHSYTDLHTRDPTYAATSSKKEKHTYMELPTRKTRSDSPQPSGSRTKTEASGEGSRSSAVYANQAKPEKPEEEEDDTNYYNVA